MNLIESIISDKPGKRLVEAISGTTSQKCTDFLQKYKSFLTSWTKNWPKLPEFIAANPNEDYSDVRYDDPTYGKRSVLGKLLEGAAARMWTDDAANALIDAGANANAANAEKNDDRTAFQSFMYFGNYIFRKQMLEKLISAGADVDSLDTNRMWNWFTHCGRIDMDKSSLQFLFELNPVNFNSPEMEPFARWSFEFLEIPAIEFMIEYGYKLKKFSDGKYPWEVATLRHNPDEAAKRLETYGFDDIAERIPDQTKIERLVPRRNLKHLFERRNK